MVKPCCPAGVAPASRARPPPGSDVVLKHPVLDFGAAPGHKVGVLAESMTWWASLSNCSQLTPYPPRVLSRIDDTRLAIQEGSAMSRQALTEASYPSGGVSHESVKP
jgi:hypothetical protein